MSEQPQIELTKAQLDRIEKNRQKALMLKQSRLTVHPYSKTEVISIDKHTITIGATKYKDTGGGFLLEETPDKIEEHVVPVPEIPPILEPDRPDCIKCDNPFATSWLFETFDYKVCDECKEIDNYELITKTEALTKYLLKDCDLDKREPQLKYIERKNPHNVRWGRMKLYLEVQVEKRALEVWGSVENLEKEKELREEKKIVTKSKKYQKEMKKLRMNIRSSVYDKTKSASHTHEFGPDTYNEDDDTYTHSCLTCEYEETYEKM